MPVIEVTKDFVLTLDDQTKREFKRGEHVVEPEIADHWYVKAHSKVKHEPPAQAGEDPTQTSGGALATPPAQTAPPSDAEPDEEENESDGEDEPDGVDEGGAATDEQSEPPAKKPPKKKK